MWRDPYWCSIPSVLLLSWRMKYPEQINAVVVRNGVFGLNIEPSSRHLEKPTRLHRLSQVH